MSQSTAAKALRLFEQDEREQHLAQPEQTIVVSDHARTQARRRGIDADLVVEVARSPEQTLTVRPGREIRQSRREMPPGGTLYLLRVIVDVAPSEVTVVTAYRTIKIRKYWSAP